MSKIELAIASAAERPTLENLMQLYVHDFSELWWGRPGGELGEDGRFDPYPLDDYWSEASHIPLLLRVSGRLAGFALVDAESHSGQPTDWNVAEFFIARKYRRGGYGTAAAHGLFDRYGGRWEAAVARRNVGALQFWRRAIGSHPLARDVREIDVTSQRWNGPIFQFRIEASPPAGTSG
jgi:predicted acetyltransferase